MNKFEKHEFNLFDSERKGLDFFIKQAKNMVFQVLYVLRKEEWNDTSMWTFYIYSMIDYLQLHSFAFNSKTYTVWKADTISQFLINAFNPFQLRTYLPTVGYPTLLVVIYLLEFNILLIILDIIYISYSFSKNRFKFMWPLYVLRIVTIIVVTIGFIPITQTLASIVQCSMKSGQYVMQEFSDINQVCWQGWHIFHASFAIIFLIVFVIISGVIANAFFEPSMNSPDRTAKSDSRGEMVLMFNKIVCSIIYSFLGDSQSWILIMITFALSAWLFAMYNVEDPYYDVDVSLLYQILSTYYLWANINLSLCVIFENNYKGGIVAWIVGMPFILTIMVSRKQSKISILLREQQKYRSGQQIWNHIRYVLQLMKQQKYDKNSFMLLVGYIEKHRSECSLNNCELRKPIKKKEKEKSQLMQIYISRLIVEIEKMFLKGLEKFPKSATLRIFYSLFLVEQRNDKNRGYEQLEISESADPVFYQQFIIYKYKKIIKEQKEQTDDDDEIVNAIAYNNHLVLCEDMMNMSANLHKEFWQELKEDQPDLIKLMRIGSKITKTTNEAKTNFIKMQKIKGADLFKYQSLMVYSEFVLNVLNDQKQFKSMIKIANHLKQEQKKRFQTRQSINYETQPIPYLYSSAKSGNMKQINTLFTTYFGYQKEEVLNKTVSMLLPEPFSSVHDKYVANCFESILINLRMDLNYQSKYLDDEHFQYFVHKNEYLFPLYYKVTLNLDSLTFIATFRSDNQIKTQVVFIVDKQTQIYYMTSSAIMYFDLEIADIKSYTIEEAKQVFLNEFFTGGDILKKDGLDVESNVVRKNGAQVKDYYRCYVQQLKIPLIYDPNDEEEKQIQLQQPDYSLVILEKKPREEAQLGYLGIKNVSKSKYSHTSSTRNIFGKKGKQRSPPKQLSITQQFFPPRSPLGIDRFDTNGSQIDQQYAQFLKTLYQEPNYEDYRVMFTTQQEIDTNHTNQFDNSIITRRLINNQIQTIDDEYEQLQLNYLNEQELEDSIFRKKNNLIEDDDDLRIFYYTNSNDLVKRALNTSHKHQEINQFLVFSALWLIFLVAITIMQYYFLYVNFGQFKKEINMLYILNQQGVQLNKLLSSAINFGIHPFYEFETQHLLEDLNNSAYSLLMLNQMMNSQSFNAFSDEFSKQVTIKQHMSGSQAMMNVSLESALVNIISQALNLSVSDPAKFNLNSPQVEHVIYNILNVVDQNFNKIQEAIYKHVQTDVSSFDFNLYITIIVLILVTIIAMIKFITVMFNIKEQRENILFLFLDIPQQQVEQLRLKCDKFTKNFISIQDLKQKNELDGYESNEEDFNSTQNQQFLSYKIEQLDEEDQQQKLKSRRKIVDKYRKNKLKGNQGIIAQFVIIAMGTFIFAVYNIISSSVEKGQIGYLLPQFYDSLWIMKNQAQYLSRFKLMLANYTYDDTLYEDILDETTVFTGTQQRFDDVKLYNLQKFKFSIQLLDRAPSIAKLFLEVYYGDLCQLQNQNKRCSESINGNLQLGLYNTEQYYLQQVRIGLEEFSNNLTLMSQILKNPTTYESLDSLFDFAVPGLQILLDFESNFIYSSLSGALNIQFVVVIIFICLLIVVYLLVWVPFLIELNTRINQNIEMLNMIPLDMIKQIKSLRRFIKNLIKQMDS